MSFLDKAKAAAQQAATKAKEGADQAATKVQQGVEDVQVKRDLTQAYGDLGRTAYSLVSRGALSHAEMTPLVERISELEAQAGGGDAQPAATGASSTPGAAAPANPGEPGTPGAGAPGDGGAAPSTHL